MGCRPLSVRAPRSVRTEPERKPEREDEAKAGIRCAALPHQKASPPQHGDQHVRARRLDGLLRQGTCGLWATAHC